VLLFAADFIIAESRFSAHTGVSICVEIKDFPQYGSKQTSVTLLVSEFGYNRLEGGVVVRPKTIRHSLFLFVIVMMAVTEPARSAELDAASPKELIEVLMSNVYLTGNIVKRMAAQKRLERIGKQDPQAVVPLIIKELSPPRSYGKIAGHQRLALIELLRDLGPAAEASTPLLVEILNDAEEPYESIKTQAASALDQIGTGEAKAAVQAYYASLQREFAGKATRTQAARSVAQSAFLIRQELRKGQPSDGVISASVESLSALGPRSAAAIPTLLRAYNDPRLGVDLHNTIGDAIRTAGVGNVEDAAQAAAQRGVPDILSEVIAETRHRDPFVRSLAMIELGRLGASGPAIDAIISALNEGRNPGDAARVLGDFGKPAARALPNIARYFDDESSGSNAIQAVGKIGVKNSEIVAGLRRVLATPGHRHRGQAARALGDLEATEALPELQRALADGSKYVRILSANALGKLGPAAAPAVEALMATLSEPDLDLRRAAVVALGKIGRAAAAATAIISEQLDSGDTRLKNSARQALVEIGGPQADVSLMLDASRFADADLAEIRRLGATHGIDGMLNYLFRLPEPRASPLARRLLSEQQPDSAYVGALFLARRGDIEAAIPILVDNLARRPGAEKIFTRLAYSMMHGGDQTQIQPLIQALLRYVEENRDRYNSEEQARLESLFKRGAGQQWR
jgi:HEAT repeat protein